MPGPFLPTRDLCDLKTLDLSLPACLQQAKYNLESLSVLLGASGAEIRYRAPTRASHGESDFTETHRPDPLDGFERQYITRWLTRLVSELVSLKSEDATEMQSIDSLADRSSELLALCAGKMAAGASIKTHVLINDTEELRIKLQDAALVYDSLGTHTWGAAPILSQLLLPLRTSATKLLELGSGTGLVGLAIAMWCRRDRSCKETDIYLTDFHPQVLHNLAYNVALNGWNDLGQDPVSAVKVHVRTLDWQFIHQAQSSEPCATVTAQTLASCPEPCRQTRWQTVLESTLAGQVDSIIAADCVYDPLHPIWIRSVAEYFLRRPLADEPPVPILHVMVPLRPTHREEVDAVYAAFRPDKTKAQQLTLLSESDFQGYENFGVWSNDQESGLARTYRWFQIGWTQYREAAGA